MSNSPNTFSFDKIPGSSAPTVRAAGCVLAGGKSHRMGTDKALLEFDGKSLLSHAVECFLSQAFPEILISASDSKKYVRAGVRTIPDERPGIGPLGGLIAILKSAETERVCFRPVDTPLIPAKLHVFLAYAAAGHDAAVPVFGGRCEPLLACLDKTALPTLETLAARGDFKTAAAFTMLDTVYLPLDAPYISEHFGDPSAYLLNANDPETFSRLGKR